MENYQPKELTILAKVQCEADVLKVVMRHFEKYDCKVALVELQGRKKLAYMIDGEEKASYLYIEYFVEDRLSSLSSEKLDKSLNECDEMLRYLDVKVANEKAIEKRRNDYVWKFMMAKA